MVLNSIFELDCKVKIFAQVKASKKFLADSHYNIHCNKRFFGWLTDFVSFGELVVLIIEGDQIINRIREELGPALIEKAVKEKPLSIRAKFGICQGINVAHASDCVSNASREISLWKKEFNLDVPDPYDLSESYIAKYSNYEYVETEHYRKIVSKMKENDCDQETLEQKIFCLLRKENPVIEDSELTSFSKLILNSIN